MSECRQYVRGWVGPSCSVGGRIVRAVTAGATHRPRMQPHTPPSQGRTTRLDSWPESVRKKLVALQGMARELQHHPDIPRDALQTALSSLETALSDVFVRAEQERHGLQHENMSIKRRVSDLMAAADADSTVLADVIEQKSILLAASLSTQSDSDIPTEDKLHQEVLTSAAEPGESDDQLRHKLLVIQLESETAHGKLQDAQRDLSAQSVLTKRLRAKLHQVEKDSLQREYTTSQASQSQAGALSEKIDLLKKKLAANKLQLTSLAKTARGVQQDALKTKLARRSAKMSEKERDQAVRAEVHQWKDATARALLRFAEDKVNAGVKTHSGVQTHHSTAGENRTGMAGSAAVASYNPTHA